MASPNFNTIRIVAKGTNVKVYIDGVLKMDATTSYVTGTYVGVNMQPLSRLGKITAVAS